jgi:hypothetical protein
MQMPHRSQKLHESPILCGPLVVLMPMGSELKGQFACVYRLQFETLSSQVFCHTEIATPFRNRSCGAAGGSIGLRSELCRTEHFEAPPRVREGVEALDLSLTGSSL